MGHAIYAESDPRAEIFKRYVEKLAAEKGSEASAEFNLYRKVERLAPEIISENVKSIKESVRTLISSAGLSTICSICRRSCIHQCLQSLGLSAGPLIELKN